MYSPPRRRSSPVATSNKRMRPGTDTNERVLTATVLPSGEDAMNQARWFRPKQSTAASVLTSQRSTAGLQSPVVARIVPPAAKQAEVLSVVPILASDELGSTRVSPVSQRTSRTVRNFPPPPSA